MKRTITGIALVLALVFTPTAWSQEPPMEPGKMGMGESSQIENSYTAARSVDTLSLLKASVGSGRHAPAAGPRRGERSA